MPAYTRRMNLAELQRALQQHVIDGDDEIAAHVEQSESVPAATRLQIYAEAYRLRLVEALAANFPKLQELLGTDTFGAVARRFLHRHPSANPSVRWFGRELATYLRDAHPDQPILAEFAQWEWAIAAAFDAPDDEPLTDDALSVLDPADWPTLLLKSHPSVQLLGVTSNIPAIFKALSNGTEPPEPAALDSPQPWVVWRQDFASMYRSLPEDEAAALQRLATPCTFEALCDTLCEWHDAADVPARAVILLKGWIRDAMIVRG